MKSLMSFCQSVCKHSYVRNYDLILIKLCTMIWGPKRKIEFVWDKSLITASPVYFIFKICITAYGEFKDV